MKEDGTGDGSSWEKAMSPKDFAITLPEVPNGTTFHVAEGRYLPVLGADGNIPEKSSACVYTVNSGVSIIGGYPADARTGALANPEKYETVFTADVLNDDKVVQEKDGSFSLENRSGNTKRLFYVNSSLAMNGVAVRGAVISGISLTEASDLSLTNVKLETNGVALSVAANSKVKVDECAFNWNKSSRASKGAAITMQEGGTLSVENTLFYQNEVSNEGGAIYFEGDSLYLGNSTFDACSAETGAALFMNGSGKLKVENGTFANNRCVARGMVGGAVYVQDSKCGFYNNTFVNNYSPCDGSALFVNGTANATLVGNIIIANGIGVQDVKLGSATVKMVSNYNLFTSRQFGSGSQLRASVSLLDTIPVVSEGDKVMNRADLEYMFDGVYDASTQLFVPVLKDNGGSVPTMALKSDRLPDGTSIRFPLSATSVAIDQRGAERLPMVCMGAMEFVEEDLTGGGDPESTAITFYPNPATDVIYVKGATNCGYRISDMQGRELFRGEVSNGGISISSLTPGIYSITIENGGSATFVKR